MRIRSASSAGRSLAVTAALAVVASALLAAGCGGEGGAVSEGLRGDSLRAVYEQNLAMMAEFGDAMEAAGNADQVTAAVNRYTEQIEKLAPRIRALRDSRPELAEMERRGEFLDEAKDLEEEFAAMAMRMMRAMAKAMQYDDNPRVQQAIERMLAASEEARSRAD